MRKHQTSQFLSKMPSCFTTHILKPKNYNGYIPTTIVVAVKFRGVYTALPKNPNRGYASKNNTIVSTSDRKSVVLTMVEP